ncbi:HypC/HybG/HupF family hydrogenase formation chaperone [Breoghania sp.]|uniref:HypC/HybG/HupF family hydrogenase formation chaperone n=1 Tax=Breoghania sp. TaxID=2065378 RepID=UPI002605C8F9|nr:HypC/HybG/HupF family hydrogenase formation chaperone [Breoghania sp.]MDJ0931246.1 HypC/HybG/HupF family hydrogenase formation chaperone [Breoghania sp.]
MCLAIPAEVIELQPNDMGKVSIDDVAKSVSPTLLENIAVGNYVLIHVGFALIRISPEEAKDTLDALKEMGELAGELNLAEMAG